MNLSLSRLTSWIRRALGLQKRPGHLAADWELIPFSFRMDWFGDKPKQLVDEPVVDRPPISVEAFTRLNALWEAQNWSTGGELHLSLDDYRNGVRAKASNDRSYHEGGGTPDVEFVYIRRPIRENRIPDSGDTAGASSKL